MRARELFLESKAEKNDLTDLVHRSSNTRLLTKILTYLGNMVTKDQDEPEPNQTQQPEQDTNISEDMETSVKAQVLAMLAQLDDNSPEWDKLIDVLRKDELSSLATQVIMKKLGAVNGHIDKKLRDLVIRAKHTFEEKEQFLKKLASGDGYFDGNKMLSQTNGNIYNAVKANPVAAELAPKMSIEFRGDMGYGPSQGPGEFMMALLGRNIGLATKGDLQIGNSVVEIKATSRGKNGGHSGGRLYSTTGYGSNTMIKRELYQVLLSAGIPQDILLEYGMPSRQAAQEAGVPIRKGALNLNLTGIANLGELFKEYDISQDRAKQIVKVILDGLYTKLPDGMDKLLLDTIKNDGTIDPREFLIEMTKLAHEYYMGLEGHAALMLFNTESGNYAIMYDADDVGRNLHDNTISLTSHLDLDDDRAKGSSQLIIK